MFKRLLVTIATAFAIVILGFGTVQAQECKARCECAPGGCGCILDNAGNGCRCNASGNGCFVTTCGTDPNCGDPTFGMAPNGSLVDVERLFAAGFEDNSDSEYVVDRPVGTWEVLIEGVEVARNCSGFIVARHYHRAAAVALRRGQRSVSI